MQPSYKYIRMIKRKPVVTLERFREWWVSGNTDRDRQLIKGTAVRRLVKNVATGEVTMGGTEPPFDAMLAAQFDALADVQSACAGGKLNALLDDDPSYIDASAPVQEMIADEYQMGEKPDAASVLAGTRRLKIIRTVFRRDDLTHQQFKEYWLANHSKLEDVVIKQSPVIRIVASFAIPGAIEGEKVPFDGMVELYFKSAQDIRSMFASEIPAMMRKDEENFVQMDAPAIRFVAEEFVVS
jgi:uncharacterized protein (TIGR02118 family)